MYHVGAILLRQVGGGRCEAHAGAAGALEWAVEEEAERARAAADPAVVRRGTLTPRCEDPPMWRSTSSTCHARQAELVVELVPAVVPEEAQCWAR